MFLPSRCPRCVNGIVCPSWTCRVTEGKKSSCGRPPKVHVCSHPWRDTNHHKGWVGDLRQTRGQVCRVARSPRMRSSPENDGWPASQEVCDFKYSSCFYHFCKPWNEHPDEYSRPLCWVIQNSSGFKTTGIILSFVNTHAHFQADWNRSP